MCLSSTKKKNGHDGFPIFSRKQWGQEIKTEWESLFMVLVFLFDLLTIRKMNYGASLLLYFLSFFGWNVAYNKFCAFAFFCAVVSNRWFVLICQIWEFNISKLSFALCSDKIPRLLSVCVNKFCCLMKPGILISHVKKIVFTLITHWLKVGVCHLRVRV